MCATETRLYRKGFGLKKEILPLLAEEYHSALVDRLVANGHVMEVGDVTFLLAEAFGFCYGVDRAVEYAYETRRRFPDRRIFLTGEIIHNPYVNHKLREMGIGFLSGPYGEGVGLEDLQPEDVVLLPAFGVTTDEMATLQRRECILVDTTCGSVLNVWKRVDRYAREGYTAVVHGKWYHEETRATCSRATSLGGHYLVVRDREEAQLVIHYLLNGGDREAFLARFRDACSPGFDPDRHLAKVGVANQTTMLMSESLEIAAALEETVRRRDGAAAEQRFLSFDTICSATQERQDAILRLIEQPLDLLLVIGGWNSSNTMSLTAIAGRQVRAYHIDDPGCLLSAEEIRHRPVGQTEARVEGGWLPAGPVRIGITAGASTPNNKIGETVERVLSFRGLSLPPVGEPRNVPGAPV